MGFEACDCNNFTISSPFPGFGIFGRAVFVILYLIDFLLIK